jgi:hypothetical protein
MTRPEAPEPSGPPVVTANGGRVVPIHEKLVWSADDVSALTGLSRRLLERERSAGRMPSPEIRVGRRVLWRPETIRRWIEEGGRKCCRRPSIAGLSPACSPINR